VMPTVLFVLGAGALVAGFALWWLPAAFMVAGVMACAGGVLLERGGHE
jgi:uncharacterized membrane protein